MGDDDDIVDGPFDPDAVDVEYVENTDVEIEFEVVLDEGAWRAAEKLAARDGVSITDAVRQAIQAQAKTRA
jgi:hypothetical protein